MKPLLLLLILSPLPLAVSETGPCFNEAPNGASNRGCAFKRLVQSDKNLKAQLSPKTFKLWAGIRQRMCTEAYGQYKKKAIYPELIMNCSLGMNKSLLEKRRGFY